MSRALERREKCYFVTKYEQKQFSRDKLISVWTSRDFHIFEAFMIKTPQHLCNVNYFEKEKKKSTHPFFQPISDTPTPNLFIKATHRLYEYMYIALYQITPQFGGRHVDRGMVSQEMFIWLHLIYVCVLFNIISCVAPISFKFFTFPLFCPCKRSDLKPMYCFEQINMRPEIQRPAWWIPEMIQGQKVK